MTYPSRRGRFSISGSGCHRSFSRSLVRRVRSYAWQDQLTLKIRTKHRRDVSYYAAFDDTIANWRVIATSPADSINQPVSLASKVGSFLSRSRGMGACCLGATPAHWAIQSRLIASSETEGSLTAEGGEEDLPRERGVTFARTPGPGSPLWARVAILPPQRSLLKVYQTEQPAFRRWSTLVVATPSYGRAITFGIVL